MSFVKFLAVALSFSLSRFLTSSIQNPKKYEHLLELDAQQDLLSRNAMQRSADQWLDQLRDALQSSNHQIQSGNKHEQWSAANQERIYKILLDGLICNYHRMVSCEQIKSLLFRAIEMIKSNHLIFSKMTMNPKKVPTPFQRLYWWNVEMRDVLADVAKQGSWDKDGSLQFMARREVALRQEVLQSIKADAAANHRITENGDTLHEALEFTCSLLERMDQRKPSAMELQFALTLFQLIIDIRPYVESCYGFSSDYYKKVIQTLVSLSAANLKHTMKIVDILMDGAPDLMNTFWNTRNHFMQPNSEQNKENQRPHAKEVKLHPAEIMMNLIESFRDGTAEEIKKRILIPGSIYYQDSVRDLQFQRASRGEKCGSLFYFHAQLLKSMTALCTGNEGNIDDEGMARLRSMISCTTLLLPRQFGVKIAFSNEGFMTDTLNQILQKCHIKHNEYLRE